MKILLLSPLPPPTGGIATWTEEYCRYLKATEHSIHVINTALTGRRAAGEQKKHLTEEFFRNRSILRQMRRAMAESTYDIVHINTSCSALGLLRDLTCGLMAKGRPVILHCHCDVEDQVGNSRLGKWLLSVNAKRASQVWVQNERSRNYLQALGCRCVTIVPCFLDAHAIAPARSVGQKIEKILFVGHIRKEKGMMEMFRAAAMLPDITFQAVGPNHADLRAVEIPPNVHLLGNKGKEEVLALLKQADVFLFPSHTEGFSIALLEAMAAGLPIIATAVGANADMLEGRGGILIPVEDPKQIVCAVEQMQSRALRHGMSEWNLAKVTKDYTAERVIAQMMDQYLAVTAADTHTALQNRNGSIGGCAE